jgi:hypothetical protein
MFSLDLSLIINSHFDQVHHHLQHQQVNVLGELLLWAVGLRTFS